jgi:hypothetical protein
MGGSNGSSEVALWHDDLPYWARFLIGGLLLIASWWVLTADVVRGTVGSSVAVAVLGIVSASSLRGMHVPLAVWPDGPLRPRFSVGIVVLVAVVFSLLMVVGDPQSETVVGEVDRGVFVLTVLGVISWGFSWSFVRQGGYAGWYGMATAAGLAPFLVGLLESGFDPGGGLCLFGAGPDARCAGATMRVFLFLVPAYAAMALVTLELTFRRLLMGLPRHAHTLSIVASAGLVAAWTALVGSDVPLFGVPWYVAFLGALAAGSLYLLGGSLLVSSTFTAILYAGYLGLAVGQPMSGSEPVSAGYLATLMVVGVGLYGLALREHGMSFSRLPIRRGT